MVPHFELVLWRKNTPIDLTVFMGITGDVSSAFLLNRLMVAIRRVSREK